MHSVMQQHNTHCSIAQCSSVVQQAIHIFAHQMLAPQSIVLSLLQPFVVVVLQPAIMCPPTHRPTHPLTAHPPHPSPPHTHPPNHPLPGHHGHTLCRHGQRPERAHTDKRGGGTFHVEHTAGARLLQLPANNHGEHVALDMFNQQHQLPFCRQVSHVTPLRCWKKTRT